MEVNDVVGSYGAEYVASTQQSSTAQEQQTTQQTSESTQYQESGKGQVVDYSA